MKPLPSQSPQGRMRATATSAMAHGFNRWAWATFAVDGQP
jgi:hypothetical protein